MSSAVSVRVKQSGSRAGGQLAGVRSLTAEHESSRRQVERHEDPNGPAELRAHGQRRKLRLPGTPAEKSFSHRRASAFLFGCLFHGLLFLTLAQPARTRIDSLGGE